MTIDYDRQVEVPYEILEYCDSFTLDAERNDLRYIDWESGPEFPRILNQEDKKKLLENKALFARKFNFNRDFEFINNLLENLK